MNRRELLIGFGTALFVGGTSRLVEAAAPGSWVLYVSAADCRVCRGWEVDHQAAFVHGLQRHGIGFRQITVTSCAMSATTRPGQQIWRGSAIPIRTCGARLGSS